MANRFFVPHIPVQGEKVIIEDKKIIHQMTKVLRLGKNDLAVIFSSQAEYELVLKEVQPNRILATILEKKTPQREPEKSLFLYLSPLKKDFFEWVLQKGVELGVKKFVPVVTQNSVVREISSHKFQRYLNIIKEATEQCGGQHLAKLEELTTFAQAVAKSTDEPGQKIIAWEGQQGHEILTMIDKKTKAYHLFIGPEGGFSPSEIALAEKNNFTQVSLGKRILRAETAAIAACSLVLLS